MLVGPPCSSLDCVLLLVFFGFSVLDRLSLEPPGGLAPAGAWGLVATPNPPPASRTPRTLRRTATSGAHSPSRPRECGDRARPVCPFLSAVVILICNVAREMLVGCRVTGRVRRDPVGNRVRPPLCPIFLLLRRSSVLPVPVRWKSVPIRKVGNPVLVRDIISNRGSYVLSVTS